MDFATTRDDFRREKATNIASGTRCPSPIVGRFRGRGKGASFAAQQGEKATQTTGNARDTDRQLRVGLASGISGLRGMVPWGRSPGRADQRGATAGCAAGEADGGGAPERTTEWDGAASRVCRLRRGERRRDEAFHCEWRAGKIRPRRSRGLIRLRLCSALFWIAFDCIEDERCRLLNVFQTLEQQLRVSAVQRHVVGCACTRLKTDSLANNERYGLGFGLTNAFWLSLPGVQFGAKARSRIRARGWRTSLRACGPAVW